MSDTTLTPMEPVFVVIYGYQYTLLVADCLQTIARARNCTLAEATLEWITGAAPIVVADSDGERALPFCVIPHAAYVGALPKLH